MSSIHNLERAANRARASRRPANPKDMMFDINLDALPPGFVKKDVTVGIQNPRRHVILASDEQVQLLKTRKRLYIDGTFRLVRPPFKQLFAIHGFMENEAGQLKQEPLAFVLMSRRTIADYKKMFKGILELCDQKMDVSEFVADFEKAAWRAIQDVFPTCKIVGCAFHFTQALFRRLKKLGLVPIYRSDENLALFCKKFMCLHLLPYQKIPSCFASLCSTINDLNLTSVNRALLQKWVQYIEDTWITSSFYLPSSWSVFMQTIRTNNDAEGWHHRINRRARTVGLNFYTLVPLLHREARLIPMHQELLHQQVSDRRVRSPVSDLQAHLNDLWGNYNDGVDSSAELLASCASLYMEHNNAFYFNEDKDDEKDETYLDEDD